MNRMARCQRAWFAPLFSLGLALLLLTPKEVGAWKVYTHVYIAKQVRADVVEDGRLTINGVEYTVDPSIVDALRDYPEYYYGGVIGPDGFPEVVFGQSVIHPDNTGAWIRHVYRSAWEAQSDPQYSSVEKAQILAFGYGYLTHPAGDMWAHTLVNDFAKGVFPSVTELPGSVDARSIALRHQIIEGYMRNFTPGFDSNAERGPAPSGYANDAFDPGAMVGSDISDKSTPSLHFEAPHKFVYNTLVRPQSGTPVADRGPLIDNFLVLREFLAARTADAPEESLETLLEAYNITIGRVAEALSEFEGVIGKTGAVREGLAGFVEECDPLQNPAVVNPVSEQAGVCGEATNAMVVSLTELGLESLYASGAATLSVAEDIEGELLDLEGTAGDALELAQATGNAAYHALVGAHFHGWIDNIDDGLRNWSRLGLGISRAMFDAQTFRNAQNAACQYAGPESSQNRIDCEGAVSKEDAMLHATSAFVAEYLIPMLGEPEGLVGLRVALSDLAVVVDSAVGVAGLPLNPLREARAQVAEAATELVEFGIQSAFGIDVEQIEDFATNASHWMSIEQQNIPLPGLGSRLVEFFNPGDQARLDRYMGTQGSGAFDEEAFAALHNTRVMTSLVLLGTEELNRLVGVRAFFDQPEGGLTVPANIMTDGLDQAPWLLSIDSDHAWRDNRRPRFTGNTFLAGTGQFPLWESCQTRDVFRQLFKDWETQRPTTAVRRGARARYADRRPVGREAPVASASFPDLQDPCTETFFVQPQQAVVVAEGSLSLGDLVARGKPSTTRKEPARKPRDRRSVLRTGSRQQTREVSRNIFENVSPATLACMDMAPLEVQLGQGREITMRLMGTEYEDADEFRVVHGGRGSGAAQGVQAAPGPWAGGGRDLVVSAGQQAAVGRHYRVEGWTAGRRAVVLPVQLEVTQGETSPFNTPPVAMQVQYVATQASGMTRQSTSRARRAVAAPRAKQPQRTARTNVERRTLERRPVEVVARSKAKVPPEAERILARSRGQLATTASRQVGTPASHFATEAYRTVPTARRDRIDPMLAEAQRQEVVPTSCSVLIYAQDEGLTPPAEFTHVSPESPATTGGTVEIHGEYIPEVEIYLGEERLEVVGSNANTVTAVLPEVAAEGTLYAVRTSDRAWATVADHFSVVTPEVLTPYEFMDVDASGHDLTNAYLMALASWQAYPKLPAEDAFADYQARLETNFAGWGLEVIDVFDEGGYLSGTLGSDTQGFIATNDRVMVIAFAGTQLATNLLDGITDLNILLVPPPGSWGEGVYIHQGFLVAADAKLHDNTTLHEKILAVAAQAQAQGKKIWVTGHSLGGALAMLVGYRLSHVNDIDIQGVVTFGAPRVGNPQWTEAFEAEFGSRGQRWANYNDPIPTYPLRLLGYDHPGTLFNIDESGTLDFTGEEMPYNYLEGNLVSRAIYEHMCYFDILAEQFLEAQGSESDVAWPELEVCAGLAPNP